jgi:hypothetical protein
MSEQLEISQLLSQKPDYLKTLDLAVKHEEQNSSNKNYLGWEWYDVETHPAKLVRLVTSGIARVNFKSNNATCYLLKDRQTVKKSLNHFTLRQAR